MTAIRTSSLAEGADIDLRDLFQHIIKNKRWIILIGLTTLLFSMAYVFLKPSKYQATVLLEVHHNLENSLGSINGSSQKQSTAMWDTEPVALQIALMRSNFILKPVVHALGMTIKVKPSQKNMLKVSQLEVPSKYINKPLSVVVDRLNHYKLYSQKNDFLLEGNAGEIIKSKNAFLIKIDIMNSQPGNQFTITKLSESEVIQQLRSRLMITDLSGSADASLNKLAILQLSVASQNPDDAVEIANAVAYYTQLKDKERKALQAKKSLTFLYQQLPMIQASLKESENKLNDYRSSREIVDIALQRQYLASQLSTIDKEIELTRSKWMDMSEINTAQHPFVIALDQKYQALKKQRSAVFAGIKKLPVDDQVEASLKRDVNVKNNLYMILLKRIQEQQVVTAGVVSDIQVLSQASSPDSARPLRLMLVLFTSLVVGLMLGCLAIVAKQLSVRRAISQYRI